MDAATYKAAKEAFVSNTPGSSVAYILFLSLNILITIPLDASIRRILPPISPSGATNLAISLLTLVIPVLLALTLSASHPLTQFALQSALIVLSLWLSSAPLDDTGNKHGHGRAHSNEIGLRRAPTWSAKLGEVAEKVGLGASTKAKGKKRAMDDALLSPLSRSKRDAPSTNSSSSGYFALPSATSQPTTASPPTNAPPPPPPPPASTPFTPLTPIPASFLTTYRAHMMLLTILSILAVDFPIFPRSLAKTETWGTSMMDIGVGSFVFSQGLVSAKGLLSDRGAKEFFEGGRTVPKVLDVTKKVAPLFLLGMIRVVLVKGVEYPEHVTEYGHHWSFFLTLCILPILQTLLHPLMRRFGIGRVALALLVLQHYLLVQGGIQEWILFDHELVYGHRRGVLEMNKEGLGSLVGYLAVGTLGLWMGTKILPNDARAWGRVEDWAGGRERSKERKRQSEDRDGSSSISGEQGTSSSISGLSHVHSQPTAIPSMEAGIGSTTGTNIRSSNANIPLPSTIVHLRNRSSAGSPNAVPAGFGPGPSTPSGSVSVAGAGNWEGAEAIGSSSKAAAGGLNKTWTFPSATSSTSSPSSSRSPSISLSPSSAHPNPHPGSTRTELELPLPISSSTSSLSSISSFGSETTSIAYLRDEDGEDDRGGDRDRERFIPAPIPSPRPPASPRMSPRPSFDDVTPTPTPMAGEHESFAQHRHQHQHQHGGETDVSDGREATRGDGRQRRKLGKLAVELASYSIIWWVLFGAAQLGGVGGGVSRRMANLQYILFVVAYNTTFLLGYLSVGIWIARLPLSPSHQVTVASPARRSLGRGDGGEDQRESGKGDGGGGTDEADAPELLKAINTNGLVLFLIANLLTGVVNLSLQTMYASDAVALVVLSTYVGVVCGVAWLLRGVRLLRF